MKLYSTLCKIVNVLVAILFGLCATFLVVLGRLLGLSYRQISVYFNLYLQGGLLALSGFLPLIASIIQCCQDVNLPNILVILVFAAYASIYVVGLLWLMRHYSGNTDLVYDKCVSDLVVVSNYWHLSYHSVNLVIFVAWWLALVFTNVMLLLLLL